MARAAHRCARATERARRPNARARQRCTAAPWCSALSEVLPRLRTRGGAGSRALLLPPPPSPNTSGLGRPLVRPSPTGAGPGGAAGGAGAPVRVRERRPPLPRPALLGGPGRLGLSGGAAPRERQVRGRPTRGQWAWGWDRGPSRLCPQRASRRGGDLAGTTPCPELARDRPSWRGCR